MKLIKIEIRKTSTGEWRDIPISRYDSEELGGRWPPFYWTEGNYSCDCNRHLQFRRACGEIGPNDLPEGECGDTEYSIRLTADDGSVYEDERASHNHEWYKTGEYFAVQPPLWIWACEGCYCAGMAKDGDAIANIKGPITDPDVWNKYFKNNACNNKVVVVKGTPS